MHPHHLRVTIKTARCFVDERIVAESAGEYVSVWDENDFFVSDAAVAAASGPGRFEGNTDMALVLVLDKLSLDSSEDHFLTDDYSGYVGVFGPHVLTKDERGFVSASTCSTHADAMKHVADLEDDGFGADAEDGWISYTPHGIDASLAGKRLGTFERLSRAKAAVSVEMRRSGYYPNVYLSGEHGPTVRRIDVW